MEKKRKLPVVECDDSVVAPDNQSHGEKTIVCSGCSLEQKQRVCGSGAHGSQPIDIMFVSESPSTWSVHNHEMFYGRGGRVIRDTRRRLVKLDEETGNRFRFRSLRMFDIYAVQCQVGEGREEAATIPKGVIDRCSLYLKSAVRNKRPKVILAFGATALKALGIHSGEKFQDVRGRVLETEIEGHKCQVLPTFGTRHLVAKTGLFNLFHIDFLRAMKIASGADDVKPVPFEELVAGYKFPKTVAEVKKVVDEAINHVVEGAKHADQCVLALDTETNTLRSFRKDAKVLCLSFSWDKGQAAAIPLWHAESGWSEADFIEVLGHVRRLLSCGKPKVFHNGQFDLKMLELRHGLKVVNYGWDTFYGEHLLREDQQQAYSLKVLGRSYFPQFSGYADKVQELAEQLTPEEEGVAEAAGANVRRGKVKKGAPGFDEGFVIEMSRAELDKYLYGTKAKRKKRTMDAGYERVPLDILLQYAAVDTDVTRRLVRHQYNRLKEEGFMGAKTLMHSHPLKAARSLGRMEHGGMRVDRPYLETVEQKLSKVVAETHEALVRHWDRSDEEFNSNSPAHIGRILYQSGVLGADGKRSYPRLIEGVTDKKTKTGHWKTDKKTLRAIAEQHDCPFAKSLLVYRSAHKALSGFVDDIKILSDYDGRLHTSFKLTGTSTGRLSSSDLNMQNLPGELAGVNIKKLFLPDDDDSVIVNIDYKGAEVRIFTAYSKDQRLIDALNDGLDVHSLFVQEVYGIPYAETDKRDDLKSTNKERYLHLKKVRDICKRVVFGTLYGAKAKKIAETAGITEEEAQRVIDKLFSSYPSIGGYVNATHAEIHTRGFVETFFGRRRRFPLVAVNGFFRGQAERRGVNMKIQSTSSDIVLGQLVELDEHIQEIGGRLLITVHDSIVASVKRKYASQFKPFFDHYCVRRVAEKYPWLPVEFSADIEVGTSYGETIKLEKFLADEAARPKTAEELIFGELEREALDELRDDEEARREQEGEASGDAAKADVG